MSAQHPDTQDGPQQLPRGDARRGQCHQHGGEGEELEPLQPRGQRPGCRDMCGGPPRPECPRDPEAGTSGGEGLCQLRRGRLASPPAPSAWPAAPSQCAPRGPGSRTSHCCQPIHSDRTARPGRDGHGHAPRNRRRRPRWASWDRAAGRASQGCRPVPGRDVRDRPGDPAEPAPHPVPGKPGASLPL